eukprot:151478_1
MSQITDDECKYITNRMKYIDTSFESIDCDKMASLLRRNDIDVDAEALQIIFDDNQYHMDQLMTDLCEIFTNKTNINRLLSSVFIDALHLEDSDQCKLQVIYDTILCCGFITKQDLNHHNFIKILKIAVFKVNSLLNTEEIEQIASNKHLTGQIYSKGTSEFMNSIKFAKLFKSIKYLSKKQWTNIYMNIQKWTSPPTPMATSTKKKTTQNISTDTTETVCGVENSHDIELVEEKHEESIDYIDTETDIDRIQTFGILTNATKDIALVFLQESSWNLDVAVDRYFAVNGNITAFQQQAHNTNNQQKTGITSDVDLIYNDGVEFWYWTNGKENKRYIAAKHDNLKSELLHFTQMSMRIWNNLSKECRLLMDVDHVKQITSNGNNSEIYEINSGAAITLEHVLSIKLYTDFTSLCKIFCKAFRLKKISHNRYERIESLMTRMRKVTNWARLLMESVQSYGTLRVTKAKYYRGLDSEFIFPRFITRHNAPLSTTYDLNKATSFSGDRGMIMVLTMYDDYTAGFNTCKLSAFSNEKEVLFFGATLRLRSIYQHYDNKWKNYKTHIEGIESIAKIANGSIEWNCKNNMKDIVGHILPHLYPDSKPLSSYIISLLEYHLRNVPIRIGYDLVELGHQYTWVQHIFMKHKNVPNITNLCNLFVCCDHIVLHMQQDYSMDEECCHSFIEDIMEITNKNVTIHFKWCYPKPFKEIRAILEQVAAESNVELEICIIYSSCSLSVKPIRERIEASSESDVSPLEGMPPYRQTKYGVEKNPAIGKLSVALRFLLHPDSPLNINVANLHDRYRDFNPKFDVRYVNKIKKCVDFLWTSRRYGGWRGMDDINSIHRFCNGLDPGDFDHDFDTEEEYNNYRSRRRKIDIQQLSAEISTTTICRNIYGIDLQHTTTDPDVLDKITQLRNIRSREAMTDWLHRWKQDNPTNYKTCFKIFEPFRWKKEVSYQLPMNEWDWQQVVCFIEDNKAFHHISSIIFEY